MCVGVLTDGGAILSVDGVTEHYAVTKQSVFEKNKDELNVKVSSFKLL